MISLTSPELMYGAKDRVRAWFFNFPNRGTTLTELCEHTNIAKKTAKHIVEEFIAEGFLTRTVVGNAWQLTTNTNHLWNETLKIAQNFAQISGSELVNAIKDAYPTAKVITLFGSYRKGTDTPESDIDIAVEVGKNEPVRTEHFATFTQLSHRAHIPVNVLVFNRKRVDINVFNNIANGIILWGFLEVKP